METENALEDSGETATDAQSSRSKVRKRRAKGSSATPRLISTSGGLMLYGSASSLSLSFDDEEPTSPSQGPPFNSRSATRKVSGKVSQCMKVEGSQRAEFKGGAVSFTLGGSGKLINVKLSNAGRVTSELVSCIKKVFLSAKFSPFAGGNQIVKIPVRIQSLSLIHI